MRQVPRGPRHGLGEASHHHSKGHRDRIGACFRKADLRGVPRTGQIGKHGAEDANGTVHLGKGDKTRNGGKNQKPKNKQKKTHKKLQNPQMGWLQRRRSNTTFSRIRQDPTMW